ncbi:MAG TPA: DUF190 domain-containing protein [Anaeromyxobacteraceae bacterium]|nr:DUF190 domain-containing protein [Anaeromyxobacteraceae bacterium]
MDLVGKAKRVRIYLNEGARIGMRPAHLAVVEFLRRENTQGATVIRAIEGFVEHGDRCASHGG